MVIVELVLVSTGVLVAPFLAARGVSIFRPILTLYMGLCFRLLFIMGYAFCVKHSLNNCAMMRLLVGAAGRGGGGKN